MKSISGEDLKRRLYREHPNNFDPQRGFALVNVLPYDHFVSQHIPGSLNIPQGEEAQFETRFDKSKEIILYCASPDCPTSSIVAQYLVKRGFVNVSVYEGGIQQWRSAGNQFERGDITSYQARM